MSDLSFSHSTALWALMRPRADGTWVPYPGVATTFVRGALGATVWTAREVRGLMRRLRQAGLVEPAPHGRSSVGAVLFWRITDAGVAALGDGPHG